MAGERNQLGRYMDERGMSYDELADQISALTGKKVNGNGVKLWVGKRRPPLAWSKALGIDGGRPTFTAAEPQSESFDFNSEPAMLAGEPPSFEAPSDPGPRPIPMQQTGSLPGSSDYTAVRKRIAQAYGAIGAGVSMVSHNQAYGIVFDQYKFDLAEAWEKAAKENKNVARIVEFMESGGAMGELVVCHLILVGGLVYVSGRAPALGSVYGGKLEPLHAAAARNRELERIAAEQAADGAAANGAPGAVGDAAGFAPR